MPKAPTEQRVDSQEIARVRRVFLGTGGGEEICCCSATIAGSLSPIPTSDTTVTVTWTASSGPVPPPQTFDVPAGTANFSIDFTGLSTGTYSISATAPDYSAGNASNVAVVNCLNNAHVSKSTPYHAVADTRMEMLVVISERIPRYIQDAVYVLVALERNDRQLFDIRADYNVSSGWHRTTFLLVPHGQYYARITIVRMDHAPVHMSKVIQVR